MRENETNAVESAQSVHGGGADGGGDPLQTIVVALRHAGVTLDPKDLARLSSLLGHRGPAETSVARPQTPMPPHSTVLSAERGIINTGSVSGGQHVVDIAVPRDHVQGADDGV
ncbi:hypothetical protein ABZV77_23650 [Streptomyces sp. NPDC004732]|uniref:hypothetical protein n=1 Tax=Streptomyces sp. NPDC004732 TaxID=3154290 RepID=UPI0033AC1684